MPDLETDTYQEFDAASDGYRRNEVDGNGIQTLIQYDSAVTGRDTLAAALTAASYKDGALISGVFEDEELEEYIGALNDMGVICAVRRRETDDD